MKLAGVLRLSAVWTSLLSIVTAQTPIIMSPVQDTYVRGGSYADDNFGTVTRSSGAVVGNPDMPTKESSNASLIRRGYTQFDLSSLASYPSIASATLKLHVRGNNRVDPLLDVSFVQDNSWDELLMTYNTKPDFDSPPLASTVCPPKGQWMDVDLTSAVESAVQGGASLWSLALTGGTYGASVSFATRDDTKGRDPYLEVIPGTATSAPSSAPSFSPVTTETDTMDDTFVRDSSPNNNYGDYSSVTVSYGTSHDKRYPYVKMDIDLAGGSPFISEAKLDIHVKDLDAAGMDINVYPVLDEGWNQDTITWNNQPGFDLVNPIQTSLPVAAEDTTMSIDLTDYVRVQAALYKPTFSIAILPVENGGTGGLKTKFSSSESGDKPKFSMTFVPVGGTFPPTSTPTGSPSYSPTNGPATYSQLVSLDANDDLVYVPYSNEINEILGSVADSSAVNEVPDFSNCGYKGGGVPIPFVDKQTTVTPSGTGDDRATIQAAIDLVSGLTPDANGFRGAVLIPAGDYNISEPGLSVTTGGVVIRGEGSGSGGTKMTFTSTSRDSNMVNFGKTTGDIVQSGGDYAITDAFVPVGAKTFTVTDASSFTAGDRIIIKFQPNQLWIDHLSNMGQWGWTPGGYEVIWRREIESVNGNAITLTAPVVQAIETVYGGAKVWKYTFTDEIANVGIENIRLESIYASATDENHGKSAVTMKRVRNGWVRQVTAKYFWYGAVSLNTRSSYITVEDSAMLEHKGAISGGRRYSFNIDDSDFLFVQRCLATEGRHDFVSGSRTPGPNVFVDSNAVNSNSDSGPHHRFATGQLYDNIKVGKLRVRNRGASGSGHGWAGVQVMFWNTDSTIICDAPNGGMNWAVGNVGSLDTDDPVPEPNGILQSEGTHVTPRSLYYAQLKQRLGANALHSVVVPTQETGVIWNALESWGGEGLFGDAVVTWFDEDSGPVGPGSPGVSIGGYVRNLELLGEATITYSWTQTSGSGTVTLGDASALETNAQFSAVGTYTLTLTVSGGTITEIGTLDITVV